MHKFFVDEIKEMIEIAGEDAKHISKVLRCPVGEQIEVSDGKGREALCEIKGFEAGSVILKRMEEYDNRTEPDIEITLFQCIPKGQKMEEIINSCTQLGVNSFVPFLSERTVVKGTAKDFEKKRDRWQKVAQSAAQQSKRGTIPKVREVQQFSQLPQGLTGFDAVFFAYEECRDYKISQYIEEIKSNRNRTVQKIAVIIGSEGGFSPAEAELLIQCGYRPISLGKTILRAQLAPVIAVTAILYGFDVL